MKKFILCVCAALLLCLPLLASCDMKNAGSLKSITRPYIAQYECTEATLGEDDLLKKFDYIKITLLDRDTFELSYKPKDGDKKIIKSNYSFDIKSKTLTAEIGILGHDLKQSTVVENGKFTISKSIGGKQLIMKFKAS